VRTIGATIVAVVAFTGAAEAQNNERLDAAVAAALEIPQELVPGGASGVSVSGGWVELGVRVRLEHPTQKVRYGIDVRSIRVQGGIVEFGYRTWTKDGRTAENRRMWWGVKECACARSSGHARCQPTSTHLKPDGEDWERMEIMLLARAVRGSATLSVKSAVLTTAEVNPPSSGGLSDTEWYVRMCEARR